MLIFVWIDMPKCQTSPKSDFQSWLFMSSNIKKFLFFSFRDINLGLNIFDNDIFWRLGLFTRYNNLLWICWFIFFIPWLFNPYYHILNTTRATLVTTLSLWLMREWWSCSTMVWNSFWTNCFQKAMLFPSSVFMSEVVQKTGWSSKIGQGGR